MRKSWARQWLKQNLMIMGLGVVLCPWALGVNTPANTPAGTGAAADEGVAREIKWVQSYDEGLALAKKLKRPLLLDFRADWCGPCKLMESETFKNEKVKPLLEKFVCVSVDIDREKDAARIWKIQGIPRVIMVNVHGQLVGDSLGFRPPEEFLPLLDDAARHAETLLAEGEVMPKGADREEAAKTAEVQLGTVAEDALTSAVVPLIIEPDEKKRARNLEALERKMARVRPVLMGLLRSERLAVRVGAYEALTTSRTMTLAFDPWATKAERAAALEALKKTPSAAQ